MTGTGTEQSSTLSGGDAVAGASPAAIELHYGIGAPFYALWLGGDLTYSCARFAPGDDLEAAQRRKIDYHARQSRAAGKQNVLDIEL